MMMAGKMQGDGMSNILAAESLEPRNIRGLRNATGVRSVPASLSSLPFQIRS